MSYPFELTSQLVPINEQQKTTLWMGELEQWQDEAYIQQLWFNLNEKVMVKVIRDKNTGISAGYAFVDFGTAAAARHAMNTYNGVLMPNSLKPFKLNWASGGGLIDRREDRQPEYSVFVGDLSSEITEIDLLTVFQSRYRSCKSAKIMTDSRTGMTRGYGFVRFSDQLDQQRALIEMQGFFIGSRPIRVSVATPKNRNKTCTMSPTPSLTSPNKSPLTSPLLQPPDTNTTVFVGGLSAPIREDELRQYFHHFGEIVYVKIPPGKGCGFVQYVSRASAELAIQQMNGYQIGNSRIRLSWGRSQNEKANIIVRPTPTTTPSMLYNTIMYPPMMQQSSSIPNTSTLITPTHTTTTTTTTTTANIGYNNTNLFSYGQIYPSSDHHFNNFLTAKTDCLLDSTAEELFNSVTRTLLDTDEDRKPNVNWRLNQIYAQ
ncbi:uncharacterized protein BX663DRAFT_554276 [Cokeromyces recurvatus]|uniref:uncharacterized protein n=1 Tax=Cokeromyces recurvatus TaxID=90255 RepID=UPI00221E5080|nr:uncharacterized protein BX663DRAFT_554276 [Cokeromyces recurvatus]KAI7900092.1 hypothetical protein BX663DRAFT_554276 [Cokeromyces recurvatus]